MNVKIERGPLTVSRVRGILSIIIIGGFVFTTILMAAAPYAMGSPPSVYTEHMKEFAALYAGITGVIIGYYLGKGQALEDGSAAGSGAHPEPHDKQIQ